MNATNAPSAPAPRTGLDLDRVPWGAVAVYVVLALGLAWLVMLPLWISGEGLASSLFMPLTLAMMYTPTVAALIVTFFVLKPPHRARFLGLTMPRVWRTLILVLVWPLFFTAIGFAAFFLAAALGWVEPDYGMEIVRGQAAQQDVSLEVALALTFGLMHLSMLNATFAAFGEELGWRGFLLSATAPLGFWRGTLLRGVIWGMWHAPIILLGYNFQRTDVFGVLAMCAFTLVVGVFLDWSRYWTKSVWAAAFGHGALNAVALSTLLFLPATDRFDPLMQSVLGVPGWIVMALVIGVMVLLGAFRRSVLLPLIPLPKPRPVAAAPVLPGAPVVPDARQAHAGPTAVADPAGPAHESRPEQH